MKAKRPYHHGNLRETLIEAGLELIEEKGVRGLTLRDIGARVGVSRTAAYRHFADKAHLLGAISEAGFAHFADALEKARTHARGDSAARLAAMAVAYVRFAAERPAYYEVMFGSDVAPTGPSGARAFAILEQTIRDAQQAGEVRPGDSVLLARLVWAMVHGISTLFPKADLTESGEGTGFVLFCCEVLRTGLGLRPASSA